MPGKRFTKRKEDFVCEVCGALVHGDGYTNHCTMCLHSKHVDVNPGDRAASCGGIMKPIGVEKTGDKYVLLHRCVKCGFERKNKVNKNDNFDAVLKISSV